MQQYFVEQTAKHGDSFFLQKQDIHHIVKVMRAQLGTKIRIICNHTAYLCSITELSQDEVVATILEILDETRELTNNITIALGLLKQDKFEYAVQKLTELGVYEIIPWIADRSIVKLDKKNSEKKCIRWQTIAKEASEQSKRHTIPIINTPQNLAQITADSKKYDKIFVAYEDVALFEKNKHTLLTEEDRYKNILIFIGPEGGISAKEIVTLQAEDTVSCISLGNRILRAETAAIFAMAVFSAKEEKLI